MFPLLAAALTTPPPLRTWPRAPTLITPLHSNAVTWPGRCTTAARASIMPFPSPTRREPTACRSRASTTLQFFGRSANISGLASLRSRQLQRRRAGDQHRTVYRSGLLDLTARLSVNLMGGPAMDVPEFVKWKQKKILGASLKMIAPTGQYDPKKLINWGINRWAFKPEIGYSQRFDSNWVVDAYAGVWFYTTNPALLQHSGSCAANPGPHRQLRRTLKLRLQQVGDWIGKATSLGLDLTATSGGAASQRSMGYRNLGPSKPAHASAATVSLPFNQHQSSRSPTATAPTSASAATTEFASGLAVLVAGAA